MSTLNIRPVDELPNEVGKRGPKKRSECLRAYMEAKKAPQRKVQISNDDPAALERFYKSMIQWRIRHRKEHPCGVSKVGESVYVWIEQKDEEE